MAFALLKLYKIFFIHKFNIFDCMCKMLIDDVAIHLY